MLSAFTLTIRSKCQISDVKNKHLDPGAALIFQHGSDACPSQRSTCRFVLEHHATCSRGPFRTAAQTRIKWRRCDAPHQEMMSRVNVRCLSLDVYFISADSVTAAVLLCVSCPRAPRRQPLGEFTQRSSVGEFEMNRTTFHE